MGKCNYEYDAICIRLLMRGWGGGVGVRGNSGRGLDLRGSGAKIKGV